MTIVPCSIRDAKAFVGQHHRHNRPPLSGLFAVGLDHNGALVGVAIVGRPVARMLQDGFTAEVTRTCLAPDCPRNGNSMLYGACWRAARALGWRRLVTYTLASESGASLRGSGWRVVAEVAPSKGWARASMAHLNRTPQDIYGQQKLRWEVTS